MPRVVLSTTFLSFWSSRRKLCVVTLIRFDSNLQWQIYSSMLSSYNATYCVLNAIIYIGSGTSINQKYLMLTTLWCTRSSNHIIKLNTVGFTFGEWYFICIYEELRMLWYSSLLILYKYWEKHACPKFYVFYKNTRNLDSFVTSSYMTVEIHINYLFILINNESRKSYRYAYHKKDL